MLEIYGQNIAREALDVCDPEVRIIFAPSDVCERGGSIGELEEFGDELRHKRGRIHSRSHNMEEKKRKKKKKGAKSARVFFFPFFPSKKGARQIESVGKG